MKQRGCVAVDMEMSALLTVAWYRNVSFGQFLIADDFINAKPTTELPRDAKTIIQLALSLLKD